MSSSSAPSCCSATPSSGFLAMRRRPSIKYGRIEVRHFRSRGVAGDALDPEPLQPASEGIGMEPQDGGGALGPFDDPVRPLQDCPDMAPLDFLEAREDGSR